MSDLVHYPPYCFVNGEPSVWYPKYTYQLGFMFYKYSTNNVLLHNRSLEIVPFNYRTRYLLYKDFLSWVDALRTVGSVPDKGLPAVYPSTNYQLVLDSHNARLSRYVICEYFLSYMLEYYYHHTGAIQNLEPITFQQYGVQQLGKHWLELHI